MDLLDDLLRDEGVLGVARLFVAPSFRPVEVYTAVYTDTAVRICLDQGVFRSSVTKALKEVRRVRPFARWETLKMAALAAPACETLTCDGTTYGHYIRDRLTNLDVRWSNPDADEHRPQRVLIAAYRKLIDLAGLRLERGRRVTIRSGMFAGLEGEVLSVDEYRGLVIVSVPLLGKGAEMRLPWEEVEFAG
ncbi:MAG TPA: hypothetical protein VKA46_28945 [Gemmataceae bacterium]|nr:hypothetical protein [Gemmataceae bacterium]